MKKILLSIIFFLACILSIQAQILYSTTDMGGANGGGRINKFSPATNDLTAPYFFEGIASGPTSKLTQAANGKLYGLAVNGGISDAGIIFSYDPSTSTYTKVKDFDRINGASPNGGLLEAGNGKLYGVTGGGGTSSQGVIFSFDLSSSAYIKLKDFGGLDGAVPLGSLVQANGKLYGVTGGGGVSGRGVLFSFDLLSSTYTKLSDFDNFNGSPRNGLVLANDGKLYGTTDAGGNFGGGVIFSFDPFLATYAILKNLDFTNGGLPFGSLMKANDGKLYGTTFAGGSSGNGVIYSFDPLTSAYAKLKDFDGINGSRPSGSLIQSADGKLYGLTTRGGILGVNQDGSTGVGVIFSFDLTGSILTKLKDFDNLSGSNPDGSLLLANNGKLYGITPSGGSRTEGGGFGVIFSFDLLATNYTKLKDFDNTNGRNPSGSLVRASNGKLYGTTQFGGSMDGGVIYSFDPVSSSYIKLKDFDLVNGRKPVGKLVQASDNKLYGVTVMGGSNGYGVIFSFDPATLTYTKLKDFDFNNGGSPVGGLIQAVDGKLYGLGSTGIGFIFSFDLSTLTYTRLKILESTVFAGPVGSLVQTSDGKLYGTAWTGGSRGFGFIFSFDPVTSIYLKLKDFTYSDGANPNGSLIKASDGKLYGLTNGGGNTGGGTFFSFDPSGSAYTKLKDFDINNGGNPTAALIQASDGKIYGTSGSGDINGNGFIFSFDPSTSTWKAFDGTNAAVPGSAFIEISECTSRTFYKDFDGDGFGNPHSTVTACSQPAGYVTNKADCDDYNNAIHGRTTFYRDADGDGLGDPNSPNLACKPIPPVGYVKNNYDCDDRKKAHRPWNERILMCHNGVSECVRLKDIFIKICQGWTLGPCPRNAGNIVSRSTIDPAGKVEFYDDEEELPRQYKLSNYPNPFAGTSTIKYELPFDSKVSIKVYDLLGRAVATLVDENKKAGTYTVSFNAGRISKGSLYYRIIARSKDKQFEQTNKMIQLQ